MTPARNLSVSALCATSNSYAVLHRPDVAWMSVSAERSSIDAAKCRLSATPDQGPERSAATELNRVTCSRNGIIPLRNCGAHMQSSACALRVSRSKPDKVPLPDEWCSRSSRPGGRGFNLVASQGRCKVSLFKVSGLDKSFGGIKANSDITFSLAAGEMLALIGPNGAGKSTLFNTINGQLPADKGSIELDGRELVGLRPREIWHLGVGRTFQIAQPFSSMTVIENVQVALTSRDRKLFSFWSRAADHRRDEAMQLLALVGMESHADRPCNALAYGDVKCLELAGALAHRPRLLLMDEPTAGMAPRERNDMMMLVRKLAVSQGVAVLFTEHSMDVVFACADRIIVLARGRPIANGTPESVRENPKVKEVYFGGGKTFGKNRAQREAE